MQKNCAICHQPVSTSRPYLEDLDSGKRFHQNCYESKYGKINGVPQMNFVQQIDAIKGVSKLQDECVDFIPLDPPYPYPDRKGGPTARCQNWFPAFDGTKHNGWKGAYTDPTTEDEPRFFAWFQKLLDQCTAKLRTGRYMIIFATEDFSGKVKQMIRPPLVYRKEWIWDKKHFAAGYYGRSQHEYLLVITKGKKPYKYIQDKGTILTHKRVVNGYPTEKPLPLYYDLMARCMVKEGVVLDPCCGSGNSLVAAQNLGHKYIGYDIWDHAVKLTTSKLGR